MTIACVIILEWELPSEHTNRGLRVRRALSYGVGLAVAQSGMNLLDDSCPIGDEPDGCPVGDEHSRR